jgi:hypothetical protein
MAIHAVKISLKFIVFIIYIVLKSYLLV